MGEYDIIIVGGGPAGSTAAKIAALNGLRVLCIEKFKFPRVKACGGAIPQSIIEELPQLGNYATSYITGVQIFGSDLNTSVKYERTKAKAAFVIRSEFDQQLLNDAKQAGAEILEGERVTDVEIQENGVFVKTISGKNFSGKIIFGADGTNSIVAKKAGLIEKWNSDQVALTFSLEIELGEEFLNTFYPEANRVAIFHMRFLNTFGYGWIFPKKKHINVGFGAKLKDTHEIRKYFLSYLDFCEKKGLIPKMEHENYAAALIPMNGSLKKTYSKRIMLLGDSAGFVNPINGEGIHYAVKSGMIASEVAKKIIEDNDFSEKRFREYQKRWMNDFGRDLKMYLFLRRFMMKNINRYLHYASVNELFGRLMVRVSMSIDSPRKKFWELMRRYIALRIRDIFGKLK